MPLYDFKCSNEECGYVHEKVTTCGTRDLPCPICGDVAERIISFRSAYREDAIWLPSVLEVVEKNSKVPETRAFLESPTRSNYFKWMKANNIRPLEGSPTHVRTTEDDLRQKIMKDAATLTLRHRERKRIDLDRYSSGAIRREE